MIDWSKTKFRASSWGNLLVEPREKEAKARGDLSITCQKELVKIYNLVKYGRKKDIVTKQMEKGIAVEDESITLFSRVEKKLFTKNTQRVENEWSTGHPDIYEGESIFNADEVDDIKSSWELDSFTIKLIEDADPGYTAQLNVYYDLTGAKRGNIAYCLVDAPPEMVQDELKRLQFKMNIIWDGDPEYVKAANEVIKGMTFQDIDYLERVIKVPVERDDALIQRMKDKVPKLRDWLAWLEKKHLNGKKVISTPPKIDLSTIKLTKIK
jgi:hypothetical protein